MCNCGKRRGATMTVTAPRAAQVVRSVVPLPAPPVVQRQVPSAPRHVPAPAPTPVPVASRQATVPATVELPIVDPVLWGPHLWRFLHIAAEGSVLGSSRADVWNVLFDAMLTGLPCPECSAHYGTWRQTHSIVMPTRGANLRVAVRELVRGLHNSVSVRRGQSGWSAEEATREYAGRGKAAALEALEAAGAAGVAEWVVAAGREVVSRGMT